MAQKRVLGYVRCSTAEQVDGFGLDVQEAAIRKYCQTNGLTLVYVHRDEGISGSNGMETRHGLAEALARIEAKDADALIVHKFDRLARKLLVQLTISDQLSKAGAEVISVAEPDIDGDDGLRDLIRNVLGSIAEYERTVIKGRMMRGKAEKRSQGGYVGGQPRYGTKARDRSLVPDEDEKAIVSTVKRLHRQGKSYRQICSELEAKGYRPRRASQWQPAVVRRIALS